MFKRLAVVAALALVASGVQAESRISANATGAAMNTTAALKVSVAVPRILYLRVGDAGATVNTVNFTVGAAGLTLPVANAVQSTVPGTGTITALSDEAGATTGAVTSRLWTNNGTTTLTCSSTNIAAGSVNLNKTEFTVATSGTLPHPGSDLACSGSSGPLGAAGVNDLTGTWTYSYVPALLPAAGTYTGTVTYTAAQL